MQKGLRSIQVLVSRTALQQWYWAKNTQYYYYYYFADWSYTAKLAGTKPCNHVKSREGRVTLSEVPTVTLYHQALQYIWNYFQIFIIFLVAYNPLS